MKIILFITVTGLVFCTMMQYGHPQEIVQVPGKSKIIQESPPFFDFVELRHQYKINRENMKKAEFDIWWNQTQNNVKGKVISSQGYLQRIQLASLSKPIYDRSCVLFKNAWVNLDAPFIKPLVFWRLIAVSEIALEMHVEKDQDVIYKCFLKI